MKILEHCCYKKYLSEWWQEYQLRVDAYEDLVNKATDGKVVTQRPEIPEDSWTLINFGDHLLVELLEWCLNMCYCAEGTNVTIAMPVLTQSTLEWLAKRKDISHLDIVTREPLPDKFSISPLLSSSTFNSQFSIVQVDDLHIQTATVTGRGRYFVLQNNLLQSVCPGKYITTLGISERYYKSVQPLLNSWVRLYSKNNKA